METVASLILEGCKRGAALRTPAPRVAARRPVPLPAAPHSAPLPGMKGSERNTLWAMGRSGPINERQLPRTFSLPCDHPWPDWHKRKTLALQRQKVLSSPLFRFSWLSRAPYLEPTRWRKRR